MPFIVLTILYDSLIDNYSIFLKHSTSKITSLQTLKCTNVVHYSFNERLYVSKTQNNIVVDFTYPFSYVTLCLTSDFDAISKPFGLRLKVTKLVCWVLYYTWNNEYNSYNNHICFCFNSHFLYLYFPVNGEWLEWSAWTNCSVTCEEGTITRNRNCEGPYNGGLPCEGSDSETDVCIGPPCAGMFKILFCIFTLEKKIKICFVTNWFI